MIYPTTGNHAFKPAWNQAAEICEAYRGGADTASLGKLYGCSRYTIAAILEANNVPRRQRRDSFLNWPKENRTRKHLRPLTKAQRELYDMLLRKKKAKKAEALEIVKFYGLPKFKGMAQQIGC